MRSTNDDQAFQEIAKVWRNDRSYTDAYLFLCYYSCTALSELEHALQQNPYVTTLSLHIDGLAGDNMSLDPLLRVIETRDSLKTVCMVGGGSGQRSRFTDAFFRAISRNSAIQTVELFDVRIVHSLSSLLRSSQSILNFKIVDCHLDTSTGYGVAELGAAFRENETIQSLWLQMGESYLVPILRQLSFRPKLLELTLSDFNQSSTTADAIQHLLESPSAPRLKIGHLRIESEFLQKIALGLANSKSASSIGFVDCHFDNESMLQFEAMFQTTPNSSKTYELSLCPFSNFSKPTETVLRTILGSNSRVAQIFLSLFSVTQSNAAVTRAATEALEVNTSVRIVEVHILDAITCRVLAAGIPRMKGVKEMRFQLSSSALQMKPDLMQAFKRNTSLESVVCTKPEQFFNRHDKRRLKAYTERNKNLPRLIVCPTSIPISAWPRVLKALQVTESSTVIFRCLLALGDGSVGCTATSSLPDNFERSSGTIAPGMSGG